MHYRYRSKYSALLLSGATLAAAYLSGCSSESGDSSGTGGTASVESSLEIFSWWIAPGEVEALDALLAVFSDKYPKVEVTNAAAIDAETQRERLKTRLETGEPPDSFQAVSGVDLIAWVDKGKMQSLTSLAEENGWADVYPKTVLDIVSKDGELYGVPLNIERDNNLYYSIKALEDAGITPPETLDDFFAACEKLQAETEITPIAVPAAGWVLALVAFETLMPAVTGGEFYLDYFAGKSDPDDPKIEELFVNFKKVLECSNVLTASDKWGAGADAVYNGEAAMYVMGDWAKGYLEGSQDAEMMPRDPWVADKDFGVVPGLGSKGYFTFNSAVFGLPKGVTHPKAAHAFLEVVGSKEGQAQFNPIKGSLPARTDVDLSSFDEMVQRAGADFKTAAAGTKKLLPGYASLTTLDFQLLVNPSLLVFAIGGAAAHEFDPENVPDSETSIEPLNLDYIVGKMKVAYPLLQE